jgi:hypothetical protein
LPPKRKTRYLSNRRLSAEIVSSLRREIRRGEMRHRQRGEMERRKAMGYRFSLVLSREISEDESSILREAGCASAVFGTDSLPTNAEVTVTKMEFDDAASPSLADAIESALEAVKKVPELSVPGLTVPAQPAHAPEADADSSVVAGTVVTDEPVTEDEPKAAVKKRRATKKAKVAEESQEPVGASAE